MAIFLPSGNTALDFILAGQLEIIFMLGNPGAANGQQTVNGFTTVVGGQVWLSVSGSGFSYSGNNPVDGTISSITFSPDGQTIGTLSGLSLNYADLINNLKVNGVGAAISQLLSGDDSILGTSFADVLFGREGDDVISGFAGADRLYGDGGEDTLNGGGDDDQLFGGAGNDHLFGEAGDDMLYGGPGFNKFDGGSGVDTVSFADSTAPVRVTLNGSTEAFVQIGSFLRGTVKNVENVVGGTGNDTITGDGFANTIDGFNGDDTLAGGGGADKLHGGAGKDFLDGGNGNDQLNGNSDDDVLHGGSGYDYLAGGSGHDYLDGGADADTMIGGTGDDTYVVDNIADAVSEGAGEGIDTVLASISFTLAENVENLTLTGSAATNATGNSLANVLTGNAASNRLDGKAGADTMKGGEGNDTYVVDSAGDVVVEAAGEGRDTVESSISFTLGANVEDLVLLGSSNIAGTGNALANAITGNAGDNVITGGKGKDLLTGGAGNDAFIFDVKAGKKNADTILDFSVGDVIQLDTGVFGKLKGDGVLKAKFFTTGKAADGNDYITYKEGSGKLFYDRDGDGGKKGKLIAKIEGSPELDSGDILLF